MRYLCIHGHFYQPPRENPWLEAIELQDSAYPYHDWNERITAECYAPNAAARILDDEGRILKIVNNYSLISFNFGPTLLAWAKDRRPRLHQMIWKPTRDSQDLLRPRFGDRAGLQPHDHAAGERPRQGHAGRWGIADFEYRFGRRRKACGCPKRRSTARRSISWPSWASSSRFLRRTRPARARASASASGWT